MNAWEDRYKARDMPWEKGFAAPPLEEFLARHKPSGTVLVPGCGWGHDARAIAEAGGGGVDVVGLDIAPSAIRGARERTRLENCRFEVGDFLELPPPYHGEFDLLFEHTCFCAINPSSRAAYARSAAQALRSRGTFAAIFYMNPGSDRGDGPPFGCTVDELASLFGERFTLEDEWMPTRAYPGREGRELFRVYKRR